MPQAISVGMNYCCENGFVKLVHVDISPKRASEAISELVILKKKKKNFCFGKGRGGGGGGGGAFCRKIPQTG